MRALIIGFMTFLSLASVANAESFLCTGQGKYSSVGMNTPVTVEWNNPKTSSQKVLSDDQSGVVIQFSIDKSNSGKSHYAVITIIDTTTTPITIKSAKGSIYDMVSLIDGNQLQISQIVCLPNPLIIN